MMKIFQIKTDKLTELKKEGGKKEFDYEKVIQSVVENNLDIIFPSLEFIVSEYQIDNLRPDSIAFDTDRNSFVIIEYKNVKHKGVVDQGMSYYQLLQEKREAFVLLYHKIKGKVLDIEKDVFWDEARVIFISPTFTVHQKRASQAVDLPIELYEIGRYENGLITLNKIESEKEVQKAKSKSRTSFRLEEYSEEDYLDGKYSRRGKNLKPEIRKLWHSMKNKILDMFDNLEFQQKKKYGGFYSKTDGAAICTFDARNTKIWLTYSVRKKHGLLSSSTFIKDMSKTGHWGLGHYQSEINNELDFEKALPIIKKVYDIKNG